MATTKKTTAKGAAKKATHKDVSKGTAKKTKADSWHAAGLVLKERLK